MKIISAITAILLAAFTLAHAIARPAHPHATALFVDLILSPEGQAILEAAR